MPQSSCPGSTGSLQPCTSHIYTCVAAPALATTVTGLTPGVSYTVSVAACNGVVGLGDTVGGCNNCGTESTALGPHTITSTAPEVPSVPTLTSTAARSLGISWNQSPYMPWDNGEALTHYLLRTNATRAGCTCTVVYLLAIAVGPTRKRLIDVDFARDEFVAQVGTCGRARANT